MSMTMPRCVEAVGAAAGAVEPPSVSRGIDEDLPARRGAARPDPLRSDGRDEIDEPVRSGGREAFDEPESWPRRDRESPAAVGAGDDHGAGAELRDERVEPSDEVGGCRRGQDVEQPFPQGPAALEVRPGRGRVDAVFAEKAAQCLGVGKTLRLGQVRVDRVDEVEGQNAQLAKAPHGHILSGYFA